MQIRDQQGTTMIHMASANNNVEVLQLLLVSASVEHVNVVNERGNTALHWSTMNGHVEATRVLIDAGADPNLKNAGGQSAVYYAHQTANDKLIEVVMSRVEPADGVGGDAVELFDDETDEVIAR